MSILHDLWDDADDCHLTLADFPLIRAIIAGEAKCETCYFEELDGNHSPCADCMWSKLDEWSPKEDER